MLISPTGFMLGLVAAVTLACLFRKRISRMLSAMSECASACHEAFCLMLRTCKRAARG